MDKGGEGDNLIKPKVGLKYGQKTQKCPAPLRDLKPLLFRPSPPLPFQQTAVHSHSVHPKDLKQPHPLCENAPGTMRAMGGCISNSVILYYTGALSTAYRASEPDSIDQSNNMHMMVFKPVHAVQRAPQVQQQNKTTHI